MRVDRNGCSVLPPGNINPKPMHPKRSNGGPGPLSQVLSLCDLPFRLLRRVATTQDCFPSLASTDYDPVKRDWAALEPRLGGISMY